MSSPRTAGERTKIITQAVVGWLAKRRYSCHLEVGILPWGARRADLIALNTKRHLIVVEVKQCWADFRCDTKWQEYLPFSNQFYFAFPHDMWAKCEDKLRAAIPKGVGIIVLQPNGLAAVIKNAAQRDMESETKREVITRLAWRGGLNYRKTKRYRVYL